uniref:NADH dehydrogenase subunit 5 n=1 Tax=Lychas mucronatus TaxID=172552 RepID=UPI0023D88B18|nr:NADH dehydrogenase subunit 5 [Lychas mucronatus]WDA95766.1 NADH dehydrogenase subunit 5 [Lychas mucronatus]
MPIMKTWSMAILISSTFFIILTTFSIQSNISFLISFSFMNIKSSNMEFILILDWISMTFSSAVLLISSMVLLFSEEYMESEKYKARFTFLVLLFILSMLMLIISPNMMSILLGWDGLGLVSYCLVIYYQNSRSYNAGMITILSNRIGDVMIIMAIALLLPFGSWDLISMNSILKSPVIALLILVAAMTKSAQIPFSAWLPAAMAAPTPVSALVHSSTLVTAGVFLLIRFHNMIPTEILILLMISSTLTMFMAGISATLETDLKKIIALSTLSQLAIMMLALSMKMWKLAYFHMVTHAMFKALMFLCAGYIIHNSKNTQDIRKMGEIISSSPTISICFLISSLALMGVPFTAGFYSKDLILETMLTSSLSQPIFLMIILSFGLTMLYSFRISFQVLWSSKSAPTNIMFKESITMTTPTTFLALMAIVMGALISWTLFETPSYNPLPLNLMSLSWELVLSGLLLGLTIWALPSLSNLKSKVSYLFSGNMWFLPSMSPTLPLNMINQSKVIKFMELGWSEEIGPQGTHKIISLTSKAISTTQKFNLILLVSSSLLLLLLLWML